MDGSVYQLIPLKTALTRYFCWDDNFVRPTTVDFMNKF